MTRPWLTPPTGPAADLADRIAAAVPVIETDRLILRAPRMADWPAYETVFTSDRARFMGGPYTAEAAFNDFAQAVASWLLRGSGAWTITAKGSDEALGWLYLWQEWSDPEPELGWVLVEAAEGHGFAEEAARAVLTLATRLYGAGGFVSYIDEGNEASARLAGKLGARRDPAAEAAMGEPGLMIYRHQGTRTA